MNYCAPLGIPLSEFLNWHPDDQQAALAWQADRNSRCSHCGTADWEWEENRDAYVAKVKVCRGCHRRASEEKNQRKTAEEMPGLQVYLERQEVGSG